MTSPFMEVSKDILTVEFSSIVVAMCAYLLPQ